MAEYIERNAAMEEIQKIFHETDANGEEQIGVMKCHRIIRTQPAVEVAPVVHGEWVDKQNPQWKAYDIRHCSMCGWNIPKSKLRNKDLHWNYCPNCGAKMDGERKEV